jgi:hypothetical protein
VTGCDVTETTLNSVEVMGGMLRDPHIVSDVRGKEVVYLNVATSDSRSMKGGVAC